MTRFTGNVRVLVFAAAALVLLASNAGATKIYEGDTNNENFSMTDYHITIKSTGPITGVGGVLSDDGEFAEPNVRGEGTTEVSIDWYYVDAPPGDSIGFCIKFEAGNGYTIEKSFTAVKGTVELKLPVLGETATSDGHTLTNAYGLAIAYRNLQANTRSRDFGDDREVARLLEAVAGGEPFELGGIFLGEGEVPPHGKTLILEQGNDATNGERLLFYYEAEFIDGPAGHGFTLIEASSPKRVKPADVAPGDG